MQRVRHLAHERLIAPARPLLDHHQPYEQRHRDRWPAALARLGQPARRDRGQQRRIAQQLIQPREFLWKLANRDRQRVIKQRLDLLTDQTKHPAPPEVANTQANRLLRTGQNTIRHSAITTSISGRNSLASAPPSLRQRRCLSSPR